jgi:MFS transporter, DHA1 family, multidrug resistance protein
LISSYIAIPSSSSTYFVVSVVVVDNKFVLQSSASCEEAAIGSPIGMATEIIRDAPVGQLLRWLTGNRVLQYPEELPGFQCPTCYKDGEHESAESLSAPQPDPSATEAEKEREAEAEAATKEKRTEDESTPDESPYEAPIPGFEPIRPGTAGSLSSRESNATGVTAGRRLSLARVDTRSALQKSVTRADLERQFTDAINAERRTTEVIEPEKMDCGTIVVDWYDTDDPANPQNWSLRRKLFVSSVI